MFVAVTIVVARLTCSTPTQDPNALPRPASRQNDQRSSLEPWQRRRVLRSPWVARRLVRPRDGTAPDRRDRGRNRVSHAVWLMPPPEHGCETACRVQRRERRPRSVVDGSSSRETLGESPHCGGDESEPREFLLEVGPGALRFNSVSRRRR